MLGVPLELGGKLGARRAVGEAGRAQAEAALLSARAKVRIATILNLHRLRQLRHEAEVVDESVKTFSTLNNQFSSRSRLSPEQQTSATVYRMARSQYQLRRSEINDEISELNKYFIITVGKSEAELRKILPGAPTSWPTLESRSAVIESPRLQSAKANFTFAQANLDLAKSEAWPTVNVGPSFRMQTQSGISGNLLGFNIGLPIPLFNMNGAGRAAAAAGVALSEATRDLELKSGLTSREQWEKVYDQSVNLLNTTLSHQEIERAHHDIDSLFSRGVVPSSLVIEAHRSYLDLEIARHSRERKAMEALLSIYEINGSIMEKNL
ncbi:MAG: TolC family protein [Proteobacteria bacterium]|nr:MAG: TolC family protein [Pseudomonadota bacterium]